MLNVNLSFTYFLNFRDSRFELDFNSQFDRSTIKYLWPENAVCRKEYSGEVIAISGEST